MANRVIKTKSTEKVFNELNRINQPKFKKEIMYINTCEYCGKDYEFSSSDVYDNVVKCPYCKCDNVVFLSQFK